MRARPDACDPMASPDPDLADQVESIRSRDDLVRFLRNLSDDLRTRPGEWENDGLESYLDAVASWTEDMDGYFRNRGETTPQEPSWKLLGMILLAGKVYE